MKIALNGLEIYITDVEFPIIHKEQNLIYRIERVDIPENLINHYVEIYIEDSYYRTVQDEVFDLLEFADVIPLDDTQPLKVELKPYRYLNGYKVYAEGQMLLYVYNKACGEDQLCSEENIVRF